MAKSTRKQKSAKRQPNSANRSPKKKKMSIDGNDFKKIKRVDPNTAKATPAQLKYIRSLAKNRPTVDLGRDYEKLMRLYTRAEASLLIDRLLSHAPSLDWVPLEDS